MQKTILPITKIGEDYAVVFPPALRDKYGLDQTSQLEVTAMGEGFYSVPVPDAEIEKLFEESQEEVFQQFQNAFRRLAE